MSAAVTAREAAALLARQDNILILTHRRPDRSEEHTSELQSH